MGPMPPTHAKAAADDLGQEEEEEEEEQQQQQPVRFLRGTARRACLFVFYTDFVFGFALNLLASVVTLRAALQAPRGTKSAVWRRCGLN
jgi:hypothetical protein